jgi:hypothetical protein
MATMAVAMLAAPLLDVIADCRRTTTVRAGSDLPAFAFQTVIPGRHHAGAGRASDATHRSAWLAA